MTDRNESPERWVEVLQACASKLKVEYDRQQPDAPPDECWAEAEAAWALLDELGFEGSTDVAR